MELINWILVVVGIFQLGWGGYTLSRGAHDAPAGVTQEAAFRMSRLNGVGYIFVGFTFFFAAVGNTVSNDIVWALLCVVTAVVAVILFAMSVATRKSARSSTQ